MHTSLIKNSTAEIALAPKTLIVGVGNPLRHDDGIGPIIIAALRELSLSCDLLDAGTDALSLLESIKPYACVLIIDAVQMNAVPGAVKVFLPAEAKIKITTDALSTHGFGLAEMLMLAEQLEIATAISIIGIQPADVSYGEGLSEIVAEKKDEILKLVVSIIARGEVK